MAKIILERVRVSFVVLDEPKENLSGDLKYSLQVHIQNDDEENLKQVQMAIDKAIKKGKETKWGGKKPKFRYKPLRDGNEELESGDVTDSCYKDIKFLNASAGVKFKPGIVDENLQPVVDPDKIYSGCFCNVQVDSFPFKASGNTGVGWGLHNVMFIEDGDRLDGKEAASDAFASLAPERNGDDDGGFE